MTTSPLEDPRVLAVEHALDASNLDEAQRLLADLGDSAEQRAATTYLATRLLFLRGRLDAAGVAERLRDLLDSVEAFPEAEALLAQATASDRARAGHTPVLEVRAASGPLSELSDDALGEARDSAAAPIPGAPGVPHFSELPDPIPSALPERRHSSHAPRIQSGVPPPPVLGALPSLFELANLLDQRQFRHVINAIDGVGEAPSPDYSLMRARALTGAGQPADALAMLEPLCAAPLLDPELRAGCAKLLLELGEAERALDQVEQAHDDDPDSAPIRLTLTWALVRAARRKQDRGRLERADQLLRGFSAHAMPRPALFTALRAAVQSEIGDAERGISLAERALGIDRNHSDALAALAVASARLGRTHDAQQAWLRLLAASFAEAEALSEHLQQLGVELADLEPAERPGQASSEPVAVWDSIERALLTGHQKQAVTAFEHLAREHLTQLAEHGASRDFPVLATVAANFLTTSPVSQNFAPFDLSLWSIARLEAVLDVLYGSDPRPQLESDDHPVVLLLGSYLGEALRGAHAARWKASISDLQNAEVEVQNGGWKPFEVVQTRIRSGGQLALDAGLDALGDPGSEPWAHRIASPLAPPCPWDPAPWPDPAGARDLGRALSRSVIATYSEHSLGSPLDRSMSSVAALDGYLALTAPDEAPPEPDAPWERRVALLAGAYLGEVLCEALGARWLPAAEELGPDSYRLQVGSRVALPVAHVLARIERQTSTSLAEYAAGFAHGA